MKEKIKGDYDILEKWYNDFWSFNEIHKRLDTINFLKNWTERNTYLKLCNKKKHLIKKLKKIQRCLDLI